MASSDRERVVNILCIAQLESRIIADEQVAKQTIQPLRTIFYVDKAPAQGIDARRIRIAENHQKLRDIVLAYQPDYVWQIEGDSILPENTLETLISHYQKQPGVYSGIQVGRHGLYCIGAWHVAKNKKEFASVDHKLTGLQSVDAMGMYCFFTDTATWLSGDCYWKSERWGPDVNYFLSIDAPKFVDMDLEIGHKTNTGIIMPSHASTCNAVFWQENKEWRFEQV